MFDIRNDDEGKRMDIPLTLDAGFLFSPQHGMDTGASKTDYRLIGGILHVTDEDIDEPEERYENGHYVSLVRDSTAMEVATAKVWHHDDDDHDNEGDPESTRGDDALTRWTLVDDDETVRLDSDAVVEFLGGTRITAEWTSSVKPKTFVRGVLVAYQDTNVGKVLEGMTDVLFQHDMNFTSPANDDQNARFGCLRDAAKNAGTTTTTTEAADAEVSSFVGRRVRVRWAKGKYYSGIVASYNPGNGKHIVQYDDGDVREYNLSKKTIEWGE